MADLPARPALQPASSGWAPVTALLLGLLAAYFALGASFGALEHPFVLAVLGAQVGRLVAEGQVWRLVTAGLLHLGWLHLLLDAALLGLLGRVVETALGPARFLALCVLCLVTGSLASWLAGPGPSAGASGLCFGLLGCTIALGLRHRRAFPAPLVRLVARRLLPVTLALLLAGSLLAGVDVAAHLGGLLAGAAAGLVLHPEPLLGRTGRGLRWPRRAGAVLGAALLLWGVLGTLGQLLPRSWLPAAPSRRLTGAAGAPAVRLSGPWQVLRRGAGELELADGVTATVQLRELPAAPREAALPEPPPLLPAGVRGTATTEEQGTLERGATAGRWGRGVVTLPGDAPPLRVTTAVLALGERRVTIRLELLEPVAYRDGDLLGELAAGLVAGRQLTTDN